MTEQDKKVIEEAKQWAATDPDMVAFLLRDLGATIEAGMNDLAWAMVKQGNNSSNDAKYLIERVEAEILRQPDAQPGEEAE